MIPFAKVKKKKKRKKKEKKKKRKKKKEKRKEKRKENRRKQRDCKVLHRLLPRNKQIWRPEIYVWLFLRENIGNLDSIPKQLIESFNQGSLEIYGIIRFEIRRTWSIRLSTTVHLKGERVVRKTSPLVFINCLINGHCSFLIDLLQQTLNLSYTGWLPLNFLTDVFGGPVMSESSFAHKSMQREILLQGKPLFEEKWFHTAVTIFSKLLIVSLTLIHTHIPKYICLRISTSILAFINTRLMLFYISNEI